MVSFVALVVAFVSLAAAYVVGYVNQRKRGAGQDQWFHEVIFGLHVAIGRWFGNCFGPALVFEWSGFSPLKRSPIATLTFRSGHLETTIYFRAWSLDWNSEHIARRIGRCIESEGYSPTHWLYNGWFGYHLYI